MMDTKHKTLRSIPHEAWVCLFLIIITLVTYIQIGTFDFDNYDTARYIYENNYVKKGLTVEGIRWAFSTTDVSNWHPLTWLSHMLDVQLYGLEPGPHHWTSLLFHLANTVLLFLVFTRTTRKLWPSSLVAALFAIHPLHVQSVAWLAERKDLLCTFWGLLAILSYIRYVQLPGIGRYIPVLLFFILGLMAKPMIVTLPFVLLLLDYWPLQRIQPGFPLQDVSETPPVFSLVIEKVPLFLVAAGSCMITIYAQTSGGAVSSLGSYPLPVRLLNALVAYAGYIGKMFWPVKLAVFYPHPGAWPMWQILASVLLVTATTFLAIRFVKSRPWIMVGWFWYLGTLIPVIGLVQVGAQAMADRYTYMPLIGIFIILSWLLSDIVNRNLISRGRMALITSVILGGLMAATWIQLGYWKNSTTLFERALEVTENNYVAHNNLGHRLMGLGETNEAVKHYKRALEINPLYETAHLNLGFVYSSQGILAEAIHHYSKALEINPNYAVAYNNLGNALYRLGKHDQAVPNYLKAIRINSEYAEAYNGLGAVLIRLGDVKGAVGCFKEAIRINPEYRGAQTNLENTLKAINKSRS
jgi:Tfp pilus assembly protein PilF